jgi:hypothetical protein
MNLSRNVAPIALVTLLALVGTIVLLILHDPVPSFLSLLVATGIGAHAGVATNDPPAPAPAHAARVVSVPEPAPVTDQPAA